MEHDTGAPVEEPDQPDVIGSARSAGDVTAGATGSVRRRRGLAIAVGAAVLVAGGGAAALAAGTAPGSSQGAAPGVPAATSGPSGGEGSTAAPGPGRGGMRALGGGALHGRLTVPAKGGTYQDVLVQRGAVTAVTATSLAVRSADGYTHTYVLNAGTVLDGTPGGSSKLAVGDTVGVVATTDGTATLVTRGRGGPRMFPGQEGISGSGAPWGGRLPGAGLRHRGGSVPGQATPGAAVPGAVVPGSAGGSESGSTT